MLIPLNLGSKIRTVGSDVYTSLRNRCEIVIAVTQFFGMFDPASYNFRVIDRKS